MSPRQGCRVIYFILFIFNLLLSGPALAAEKSGASPSSEEKPPALSEGKDVLPITLREVIEKSLANNIAITVFHFDPKVARQGITEQKAAFDPSVNLEFSADQRVSQVSSAFALPNISRNKNFKWKAGVQKKMVTGTDIEMVFDSQRNKTNSLFAGLNPQYSTEVNINLTQPLLKNFGPEVNKTEIRVAKNDAAVSGFDFEKQVIDIISNAENTYWDLVLSLKDLKVKEKSLERARDLERRVKAQVDVGTMAPLEILQAQAEVASREEFVLVAKDLILDNEDNLKNIINLHFDSPDGAKSLMPLDLPKFDKTAKYDLKEAIKEALIMRPDYLAKKKELETRNIRVKFNENQMYPSLDLVASLGLNGISGKAVSIARFGAPPAKSEFGGNYGKAIDSLFNKNFFQWEVGLKLNYPLGNRAAKSRLTASRLDVEKLLFDIKDLERKIIVEVREAVRQLNTDTKRVEAARIARRFAEEKLAAEEKKFRVGMSTSFNILQFQEDLAEEQSREIQAIIDYIKSLIKLRQVLATTLKNHQIELADRIFE